MNLTLDLRTLGIGFNALLVLTVVMMGAPQVSRAQTCVQSGGTAECVGPDVSLYQYLAGTNPFPPPPPNYLASESAALGYVINELYTGAHVCTDSEADPGWLGLPTGATSGTRSVQSPSGCSPGGPSCNVWSQNYFLGAEVWQSHSDWAQGTTSSTAVPACASTYAYDLGPYRTRRVGCPFGYQGATDHCWRDRKSVV